MKGILKKMETSSSRLAIEFWYMVGTFALPFSSWSRSKIISCAADLEVKRYWRIRELKESKQSKRK